MNLKMRIKLCVDLGMTVLLLFLMAYSLVGDAAHEWIGTGMFVLLVLHHVLNLSWGRNIRKGKYSVTRTIQSVLVFAVLLCMIGSMVSGIILSRYVFAGLPVRGGQGTARILHMLSAYWGFVLMSIHLGFHWGMMVGAVKKHFKTPSAVRTWTARIAGLLIALYGAWAFVKRDIGTYMFLKSEFVFFNFEEPFIFFLIDYIAIMGMFVWLTYYGMKAVRLMAGKK